MLTTAVVVLTITVLILSALCFLLYSTNIRTTSSLNEHSRVLKEYESFTDALQKSINDDHQQYILLKDVYEMLLKDYKDLCEKYGHEPDENDFSMEMYNERVLDKTNNVITVDFGDKE